MIACVGETLEQREAGTTMEVVAAQTQAIAGKYLKTLVTAYFYHYVVVCVSEIILVQILLDMMSNLPSCLL